MDMSLCVDNYYGRLVWLSAQDVINYRDTPKLCRIAIYRQLDRYATKSIILGHHCTLTSDFFFSNHLQNVILVKEDGTHGRLGNFLQAIPDSILWTRCEIV